MLSNWNFPPFSIRLNLQLSEILLVKGSLEVQMVFRSTSHQMLCDGGNLAGQEQPQSEKLSLSKLDEK